MKQTKQFKRLWSLMLLLIAMLLPQGVWATINPTQPEGSGTQSDPYLISNRAELYWFATKVNGGDDNCSAKLTSDIIFNDGTFDADGTWSKAGEPESWAPLSIFNGTFDGNGHTISGLYYCNAQTNNVGFCGMLFGNIKHLGIINSYLKGNLWCGIICGNIIDGGTISDCYTCGSTVIGDYWVGCLCGRIEGGSTISNCYTTSKASGVDDVGNVCGQNNSSTLTNCYTNQEVSNGIGTHKDDSEFKSGEVTYLLTGGKNDGNQVWFQTLGEDGDAFPTFVSNGNNTVQKSDDGTSYINVVTHVHSLFKVEAEPATESAHGHNEYWACSGCDVIFTDETGTVPTNLEEMIIHSVAYENGIGTCNVCHACQYEEPTADIDGYYLIGNAGQLIAFANWVNNGQEANNAKLTANIILNDGTFADDGTFKATGASASSTPIEWPVIGRYDMYPHGYAGTFDGQGHTISGLYANYVNSGLVGLSAGECKIKNVGVINSYFDGGMVGAICGNGTVEISNCYSINVICKGSFVGGIIGQSNSNSTRVKNCYSTASLINTRGYDYQTGGIVGQMPGSTINCYTNYKSVSGWCNSETHCEASVSADRFASGEIAYKLNGSTSDGTQAWYQTIGTDAAPVLVSNGSNTVYAGYESCASENLSYSNANTLYATKEEAPHSWNDGICDICGGYQQPEGEGTEQSPYLIANKGNILWFNNSNSLANAQVKLVADVAITEAISVGSGKELTMNLDGHALTGGEGIDIFDITGGTLNLRDAESNAGKLTKGNHGVMITDGGTFNMYGGSITECTSQQSAGAAVNVNDGTFNMFGGAITNNETTSSTSAKYRGVVYIHPNNGYFNMQGGSITNNSGATYGAGVYCVAEADGSEPTDHDGCLAAGTLVTMADGCKKAIEDVAIGESVLTMNHDTGEMTAEPVFFIHKTEMGDAFTLHFSNGTDVTVVKDHSFFEKDNNRYVTLNPQNASSYIGHSFYCAETSSWVELTTVTPVEGTVGTYALLVAHTLNHLANGMLSANEPTFPVYNAFEFGDNLIIDPEKKAAAIALYGTLDYEAVEDVVSREFFDALNGQYAPVLFGKGMASMENLLRMAASYLTPNNAKQGARRRAGEVNTPHVTLSGKVIISDNKKTDDNSPSNLAVSEGMLSIGTLEAGSMIGIDLCISDKESESSTDKITDRVYGVVASDAVEGDVQYFTADNPLAGITYNEGKLAIHLHSFTNKTLTAEPVADGLYAYACDVDGCGAHSDDHIVKNGEGENTTIIELTDDGEGNFSAASVDIADGVTFQAPVAFTVSSDKVTVKRTFTADKPASVMLPFSIDASLISGATFHEFKGVSYDSEKSEWVATMQEVSTVEAYKPYLVILKADNETGKVTFGNTFADVATFIVTPDASNMQTADENGWTFKAVNTNKTWGAEDTEIGKAYGFAGEAQEEGNISAGQFIKIAAGATAAPGRCYLTKENADWSQQDARRRGVAAEELPSTIKVRFINGEATGIATLNTETGELILEGWYDLNGRKINAPAKGGIYVKDGKKVLVK